MFYYSAEISSTLPHFFKGTTSYDDTRRSSFSSFLGIRNHSSSCAISCVIVIAFILPFVSCSSIISRSSISTSPQCSKSHNDSISIGLGMFLFSSFARLYIDTPLTPTLTAIGIPVFSDKRIKRSVLPVPFC